jgi:RimJ/RimL family protein N-acetyltransferase
MTFDPSRPFADKPTLRGERILLRPFEAADIEAMGEILADPEVLRLTGSVQSSEEAAAHSTDLDERTRAWYETRHEHADRLDLAVIDPATGGCVGEAVVNEWSAEQLSANFRILLGPGGRDRGLGSEATRLTVDHAFSTTELHRLELEVFAFNLRAQRVYEKVGFVVEGVRRDALRFDGAYIDAIVMSILRPEWEARRVAIVG